METTLLGWILGFPLLGMAAIWLSGRRAPRPVAGLLASAAVLLAFVMVLLALGQVSGAGEAGLHQRLWAWAVAGDLHLDVGLLGDQLTLWFLLVITGVGFLIHVYSMGYMAEEMDQSRYFASLNFFIASMSLLVLSDNFLGLLVGWAAVGLASYLLIGFWHERPEAVAAARKAFVINTVGDVGMILAIILIAFQFGSVAYEDVFAAAQQADPVILTVIGLLLLVGVAAKSAQLPLHTWLPDAMQGPTPVSALIHAATMVTAGVYLVARAYPLYQAAPVASQVVAWMGGLTVLVGALLATVQFDIKRVLAFSTMSQVGYMILATGVGAYDAGLFHFLTHAFFKALLFLAAGVVIHALAGEQDIRRMGGLGRQLPFAYWTFLAGVLALSGIPPFAGFFSKDEILAALYQGGHRGLWLLAELGAGLTAFYTFRLFALAFAGPRAGEGGHHEAHLHGPTTSMTWPVALLAVLSIVGGWIGIPHVTAVPAHFLEPVWARYGAPHVEAVSGTSMALALILAALGALLAIAIYRPGGARQFIQERVPLLRFVLEMGFFFDLVYSWLVVAPLYGLGLLFGQVVDGPVVGGFFRGLAATVAGAGRGLASWQSGFLRRYALTMVGGVAALLIYALWAV